MQHKLLSTILLSSAALCAQVQAGTWDFTYQGFLNAKTGVFDAERQLTGTFAGEDSNADGVIAREELTYLSVGGQTYLAGLDGGCVASESPYLSCSVSRFSYSLTGNLALSVSYSGHDEFFSGWAGSVTSGHSFGDSRYGPLPEYDWEQRYDWTDRTTFAISPPPVPEPGMAALMLAGLALTGLAARRAKVSM